MINAKDIMVMIDDWLDTPANSLFGSDYGENTNRMLLRAQNSNEGNKFIQKLKNDIPILQQLDSQQLSIQVSNDGFEKKKIYLKVGKNYIDISEEKINHVMQEL